ncbi:MAG: hypothetical protein CRN43_14225 [Candidatus Nephrothrix sp. EaCA]|nr:MAG: hypothetical protein CRN43_14225 [Candidatus Nephrothrix sp. EaCA]
METVNEILKFSFSLVALQKEARNLFAENKNFKLLHEARISKLNKITEEAGESNFKKPFPKLIPQVFEKFKSIMQTDGLFLGKFEKSELRTLTYSLSYSEHNQPQIFSQPNELDVVFEALETVWKDSYLIGLMDCYLKNWETKHASSSEKLGNFIFKKLRNYDGNRPILKSLKTNMKFFDARNGDVLLGSELAIKNKQIKEAAKYLLLHESWFLYPYFSKVILAYYVKRKNDVQVFIDDLSHALHQHNNSISNKRVVSKLVIQANSMQVDVLQDKVKSIAVKLVGDPAHASNWTAFENATEAEKTDLESARKILNEWIIKQFISVFFDVCISDVRRKSYWLSKINDISGFKIYGSAVYQSRLKQDERISDLVANRYQVTRGTTALMLSIKDYVLIEFASEGSAFYAFKSANESAPNFEGEYYEGLDQFKSNSDPMLVTRNGRALHNLRDEGRLIHRDAELKWEEVFDSWLNKKVLNNV